jgi:chromosome partitioning protein
MRKITVLNQKGGVGKTTTVANLGACLAEGGRTVLLVDVDPQANLSLHFGVDVKEGEPSLYTLLRGEHEPAQALRPTALRGLSLIPSSIDLAGLSVEMSDRPDRLFVLRTALAALPQEFDYVLIDSPPSLGLLTVNAMCAADEVFIPLQTEFFALQGVGKLLHTVQLVQSNANKALRITGVIPCMHDSRTSLAQEILEDIRAHFGPKVFRTIIRKNVRLAEAPGFGVPVTQYDSACHGAEDYRALAQEVLAMEAAVPEAPPAIEQLQVMSRPLAG